MSWVNFRSNKQVTPGVFSRSSISKSTLLLETLEYGKIMLEKKLKHIYFGLKGDLADHSSRNSDVKLIPSLIL